MTRSQQMLNKLKGQLQGMTDKHLDTLGIAAALPQL